MKHYVMKLPEPKPYKSLDKRTCDLCGKESDSERYDNWNGGSYDVDETEISIKIKQKEGSSYPEGGSGQEYDIDLCPDCFKKKLIPWLLSQGAKIKPEEWDW